MKVIDRHPIAKSNIVEINWLIKVIMSNEKQTCYSITSWFYNSCFRAFLRILCVCCPRRVRRKYHPAFRSKPSQVKNYSTKLLHYILRNFGWKFLWEISVWTSNVNIIFMCNFMLIQFKTIFLELAVCWCMSRYN